MIGGAQNLHFQSDAPGKSASHITHAIWNAFDRFNLLFIYLSPNAFLPSPPSSSCLPFRYSSDAHSSHYCAYRFPYLLLIHGCCCFCHFADLLIANSCLPTHTLPPDNPHSTIRKTKQYEIDRGCWCGRVFCTISFIGTSLELQ